MSRGINKVILVGNVGQQPDVRYTQSGSAVCNFSLATTDSWKSKETGQLEQRTEWHRVVAFARLADIVKDYLSKGSKVYLEGSLRTRKWTDNNGQDRYTTEIVADQLVMLDRKGEVDASAVPSDDLQSVPQQPSAQLAEPAIQDDDIPF